MSQDRDTIDYTLKSENLSDSSKTVMRVVVENEEGTRAIGFVSVKLVRGRVKFTLTAKKHRGAETIQSVTADWVI